MATPAGCSPQHWPLAARTLVRGEPALESLLPLHRPCLRSRQHAQLQERTAPPHLPSHSAELPVQLAQMLEGLACCLVLLLALQMRCSLSKYSRGHVDNQVAHKMHHRTSQRSTARFTAIQAYGPDCKACTCMMVCCSFWERCMPEQAMYTELDGTDREMRGRGLCPS